MDNPLEGGSRTSEGGQYEMRTIPSDVVLPNGQAPLYINRNHFIDIAIQSGVNFEKVPQLPFWAGVAGYSDAWFKSVIGSDIKNISYLAGRPLTEEEAQRVAEHSANRLRAASHYTPTWTGVAAVLWAKGRKTYRFPFWTPKPGQLEWVWSKLFTPIGIKPAFAPFIWHFQRLLAYALPSKLAILALFINGPTAVYVGRVASDKNLQGLLGEIRARSGEVRRQHADGRILPPTPVGQSEGSPLGENVSTPATEQWAQTTARAEEQQQPQRQGLWRPQPPSSAPVPESQYNDDDETYLFDDASPVAPSARRQEDKSSNQPEGSAWSRLRDKAKGSSAHRPPTTSWEELRQQNTPGASYTYSQSGGENDRDSAAAARSRAQAQKEFDAMLERERRGN